MRTLSPHEGRAHGQSIAAAPSNTVARALPGAELARLPHHEIARPKECVAGGAGAHKGGPAKADAGGAALARVTCAPPAQKEHSLASRALLLHSQQPSMPSRSRSDSSGSRASSSSSSSAGDAHAAALAALQAHGADFLAACGMAPAAAAAAASDDDHDEDEEDQEGEPPAARATAGSTVAASAASASAHKQLASAAPEVRTQAAGKKRAREPVTVVFEQTGRRRTGDEASGGDAQRGSARDFMVRLPRSGRRRRARRRLTLAPCGMAVVEGAASAYLSGRQLKSQERRDVRG